MFEDASVTRVIATSPAQDACADSCSLSFVFVQKLQPKSTTFGPEFLTIPGRVSGTKRAATLSKNTVHRKVIEIVIFFREYVFSQNFDRNLSMLFAMKLRRVCSLFKKIRDSFLEHIDAQHELGLQIFVGH